MSRCLLGRYRPLHRVGSEETRAALERVTLIVMDEAHIRFRHHQAIVEHLPQARVLGLSATPLREGLGLMFGQMVKGPSYADLIGRGFLVSGRYFLPHAEDIRQGLGAVGVASTGDYVTSQLSALMRRRTIIGDVVEQWRERGENRRTICFAVDRAHSKELCDAFQRSGIAAEHIDLHTDEAERAEIFKRFRNGRTRVLCSINVLAVGFDEPLASCAILARPTLSLTMHIQQIGRVLRAADGKQDALILDHAANVLRHGKVEDFDPPELSTIDKQTDRASRTHESDYFPCPSCRAVMSPGQRVCQECGHEIAQQNTVDHVHGRLIENPEDHSRLTEGEYKRLYCELRMLNQQRGKDAEGAARQAYAQYPRAFRFRVSPPHGNLCLSRRRPRGPSTWRCHGPSPTASGKKKNASSNRRLVDVALRRRCEGLERDRMRHGWNAPSAADS